MPLLDRASAGPSLAAARRRESRWFVAFGGLRVRQPGHERHERRDVGVELLREHLVAIEREDADGADLDDLTRLLAVETMGEDGQHLHGRRAGSVVEGLTDVLVRAH